MRKSIRLLAKHFSAVLAIISICIAATSLYFSLDSHNKEDERKELSIRPWLVPGVASRENEFAISIQNSGLGPAVLDRVVVQTPDACIDSADFNSFSEWDRAYKSRLIPSLKRQLHNVVENAFNATTRLDSIKNGLATKPEPIKQNTESSYDMTFTNENLFPNMVIPANGTLDIIRLSVNLSAETRQMLAVTETGEKQYRLENDGTTISSVKVTQRFDRLGNEFERRLDKIGLEIGYCSLSGQFCTTATLAPASCDSAIRN